MKKSMLLAVALLGATGYSLQAVPTLDFNFTALSTDNQVGRWEWSTSDLPAGSSDFSLLIDGAIVNSGAPSGIVFSDITPPGVGSYTSVGIHIPGVSYVFGGTSFSLFDDAFEIFPPINDNYAPLPIQQPPHIPDSGPMLGMLSCAFVGLVGFKKMSA